MQLSAGRLHCQHTCILLHGLPYEYCTEGLTQILLDCAGCPRDTYTVRGEFFGDLAGELAAGSHLVGNGSACLAYIQTPDDDKQTNNVPRAQPCRQTLIRRQAIDNRRPGNQSCA